MWTIRTSKKDYISFISKVINALNQNSIFKEFYYFDRMNSTQDYALNLIKRKRKRKITPSVIICNSQLKGRGRRGNSWSSQKGGIWMSIVFETSLNVEKSFTFVMITAICIYKTIEQVTKLKTELKWPNDIMIGEKKTAGVLIDIETSIYTNTYIIIGIGINTNNDLDATRREIQNKEKSSYTITTLKEELKRVEISNDFFLSKLLNNLDFFLSDILRNSFSYQNIHKLYKEKIMSSKDKINYSFNNNDIRFDGEIMDVELDGSLLVKNKQTNKIVQISSRYNLD